MLAGNSAMGLWVRAGSWSSAQLTGGFIPAHMANAMANPMAKPSDPDALVTAELWHEVDGGYRFHDWSDFQPDAEAEKQKRKATSEARSKAGKAGAAARWNGKTDGKEMANECDRNGPDPSRPVPTKESAGSRKRPERPLPAGWEPNDAHRGFAREKNIFLEGEAERFKLHAQANDRRLRDWDAGFRMWLTKARPQEQTGASPWDVKGIH